jgi:hypothetical protein
MGKTLGVTGIFMSILAGAIIWFVLQVIIGVVAWVSIIAGGGTALVGVLVALGVFGAQAADTGRRRHGSTLGAR